MVGDAVGDAVCAATSNASAAAVGGVSESGEIFIPNPHRQYIDRFAAQFRAAANHANHRLHVKSRSGKLSRTNQSDTLLKLTVGAVSLLSGHVMADLCVAAPWVLSDVNDAFEDDINAADNDGGRRTAFGMFKTTSDAVSAARSGACVGSEETAAWHSALQRLEQERSGVENYRQSSTASRRQRRPHPATAA